MKTIERRQIMKIIEVNNGYELLNDQEQVVGEITYVPSVENVVIANHTFVDSSLRGQGAGDVLLDHLVDEMTKKGKKIRATCPFIVKRFDQNPKYDAINADK